MLDAAEASDLRDEKGDATAESAAAPTRGLPARRASLLLADLCISSSICRAQADRTLTAAAQRVLQARTDCPSEDVAVQAQDGCVKREKLPYSSVKY